jgi:hypothetical protein
LKRSSADKLRSWIPVLLVGLVAGGCGSTDAYVLKKNEFNRNDPDFNRPIDDREDVSICYNGIGTSDSDVANLAQEECSRFGKNAVADGESFGECPLFTPVAARFLCVAPEPRRTTTDRPPPSAPETATD